MPGQGLRICANRRYAQHPVDQHAPFPIALHSRITCSIMNKLMTITTRCSPRPLAVCCAFTAQTATAAGQAQFTQLQNDPRLQPDGSLRPKTLAKPLLRPVRLLKTVDKRQVTNSLTWPSAALGWPKQTMLCVSSEAELEAIRCQRAKAQCQSRSSNCSRVSSTA